MATTPYDGHGVRFEYPENWECEVTEEGSVTTVAIHSTDGPAFALVTLDKSLPDPDEVVGQAVEVMREEYPSLETTPAADSLAGHSAAGVDVEFFSLDVANSCAIRCVSTDRRTILVFGQWSDVEGEEPSDVVAAVRRSLRETDADA